MTLIVRLLGPVQISHDDQPISIRGYKAVALLAYLLLTAKAHTRQHLIDLFFDGPADPKASLRWILFELRQAIGPKFIQADRRQIAFNFDRDYWLDVTAFEAGRLELYRSDFLEGLNVRDAFGFEEWALFERERLRKRYQSALSERLEADSRQEDDPAVIKTAQQLLRLDNLREEWHRALMGAYARQGQREAALAQYDRCCQLLGEELGIGPSQETTALAEQIRAGILAAPHQLPDAPLKPPVVLEQPDWSPTDDTMSDRVLFVARQDELRQLDGYLDRAISGQGRVIFVTGEAGSGKTSLVQEFSQRAQATQPELVVAGGNCNAFTGVGDPYLPFREILALLTGDVESRRASGSISREQARRLWTSIPQSVQTLVIGGPDLLDVFVSSPALVQRATVAASGSASWLTQLNQLVDRQRTRSGSPNVGQTNLFEQYSNVLQALARQQPLLLVLDDLQWADPASLNLLFHLGRQLKNDRILVVGVYRPADVALGRDGERHPLEVVVNELQRNFGQIQVDLNQAEGRAFIKALLDSEPHRLGASFQEALYDHARGHALFTVEMLRGMQERGDLVQDEQGCWIEGETLDWHTLPARVEGVIGERSGRLPGSLQEILKVACVEGETFTAEVVARVQGLDEAVVVGQLSGRLGRQHRLVRNQSSRLAADGRQRLSQYRFRHILFQRYLYHTLDEAERVYLHQAVGNALEQLDADQREAVAVELARHFQMAGLVEKAVAYLQQAGDRAARLSAYQEAITHYSRALELLESLPDPGRYAPQELNLQLALGRAQIVARGSAAPEVERASSRARELSQQLEDNRLLLDALGGLMTYYVTRGDIPQGYELAEQYRQLAQDLADPVLIMGAHHGLGVVQLYRGALAQAQTHFEQMMALYQQQSADPNTDSHHGDSGVFAQRQLATVKWLQGYPEQALTLVYQALTLAEEFDHPFSITGALANTCLVHCYRREVPAVKDWAERTITLTTQHGIELWKLSGMMCHGWAMARQGQAREGIEQICHGLDAWSASGARSLLPLYLSLLAEAHMKIGQIAEGLTALEQALTRVEKSGERFWEAELHRLKGELLIIGDADDGEIEQQFLKALEIAHRQGAKSWELRAAVSLCGLWHAQGKNEEARQMLSEIYGWFTEGFDTVDLIAARELLEEIS